MKMRIVFFPPQEKPEIREIEDDLKSMQNAIQTVGYPDVECQWINLPDLPKVLGFTRKLTLVCDANAKLYAPIPKKRLNLKPLRPNRIISPTTTILGPFFICALDYKGDGLDCVSLNSKEIAFCMDLDRYWPPV